MIRGRPRHEWQRHEIDLIVSTYTRVQSIDETAALTRHSQTTVSNILHSEGVAVRPPCVKRATESQHAAYKYIFQQRMKGRTQKSIAEETGYSRSSIGRILERGGMPGHVKGRCVDCGKACGLRCKRCPYHAKLRNAELDRERVRKRDKIPPSRWRLQD